MKLIVGNKKVGVERSSGKWENLFFSFGITLICAIFVASFAGAPRDDGFSEAAVPVGGGFSSPSEREELEQPDRLDASTEDKWSFYDYIGNLFAGLIFGEW